jgi:ABC-type transporter Mla subunit MlaD
MPERAVYVRVGLLLVFGLAVGIALIWFLGGQQIRSGELAESYFTESVQGLEVGAPVKYRGVTLGHVTDMGLITAEYRPEQTTQATYRQVFVRFVVDRAKTGAMMDTARAVELGLRVRLAAQGITGLSYLELDFLDPKAFPVRPVPWQPTATYIPSVPSTLSQVQNAAQQVLAKLNSVDLSGVVDAVTTLVQELHRQVTQGDAHEALQRIGELAQTMQRSVEQTDLPALVAELRRTSEAYRGVAESGDLRAAVSGVERAATGLARAVAQLPPLIASSQTVAKRASDSTADVQQGLVPLLRDLQATAQNLREVTELLRQYPGQVFSQPPRRGSEWGR